MGQHRVFLIADRRFFGDRPFDILAEPGGDAVHTPFFRNKFIHEGAALIDALPVLVAEGYLRAKSRHRRELFESYLFAQNYLFDIARLFHALPVHRPNASIKYFYLPLLDQNVLFTMQPSAATGT
ncbi:hypothetical protein SDC9_103298 [bioreactor metagenome]|uniref:Uncharacterized protein n=1 Tax=bioreactor metagenome TaxID=1076179 RepID=A0A645AT94_9ZZZZ